MEPDELVAALLAGLEERGAPEALALAELMKIEQHLVEALKGIRRQIDAIVRRTRPSDLT